MNFGNPARFLLETVIAYGSVTAAYSAIGSTFTKDIRGILISSTLDHDVWISFDGVHGILLPHANSSGLGLNFYQLGLILPAGTQMYLKYDTAGAPAAGQIAFSPVGE